MQTDTYANLVKLIQALIELTLTLDEHRNIFQLVNEKIDRMLITQLSLGLDI